MGFEPHDLRVMSPTSYQAALPRDIMRLKAIFHLRTLYYSTFILTCQPFFEKKEKKFVSKGDKMRCVFIHNLFLPQKFVKICIYTKIICFALVIFPKMLYDNIINSKKARRLK